MTAPSPRPSLCAARPGRARLVPDARRYATAVTLALLTFLTLGATVGAAPASAHVRSTTGYSAITQSGDQVAYRLELNYDFFMRAVGFAGTLPDTPSESDKAAALEANREQILAYLDDRVVVFLDGAACEPSIESTGLSNRDTYVMADLHLRYDCEGASTGRYAVTYDVFRASDAVVEDHDNIVDYQLGSHTGRFVFDSGHPTFRAGETSVLSTVWRFVRLGFDHILSGLDHVLFVLALILGARDVRSLVKVCTVFTLAHSVTLALAAASIVHVPPAVVEPLIALSIAFVALDNLLGASPHRLWAVFAFGLLHGMGFAGALRVEGGDLGDFLLTLLSFNLGIESGQLFLILLTTPLLWLLRRTSRDVVLPRLPRFTTAALVQGVATLAIAYAGLSWFVERVVAGG